MDDIDPDTILGDPGLTAYGFRFNPRGAFRGYGYALSTAAVRSGDVPPIDGKPPVPVIRRAHLRVIAGGRP
jgi:hypothetical protein